MLGTFEVVIYIMNYSVLWHLSLSFTKSDKASKQSEDSVVGDCKSGDAHEDGGFVVKSVARSDRDRRTPSCSMRRIIVCHNLSRSWFSDLSASLSFRS